VATAHPRSRCQWALDVNPGGFIPSPGAPVFGDRGCRATTLGVGPRILHRRARCRHCPYPPAPFLTYTGDWWPRSGLGASLGRVDATSTAITTKKWSWLKQLLTRAPTPPWMALHRAQCAPRYKLGEKPSLLSSPSSPPHVAPILRGFTR
jgi:hypothetical protein